ncbi:MAG: 3-hydroxyacyl-CoA dehydrogenase family protein, partial [Oscillospiraceae bacterium]|nr:3-hydroxyacyl-CoA dehydrogenase family protein [Oscillospiraceae bacterium]
MRAISRVAIAGAGTMGYSLAQAFARFGYDVTLYDLFPAALEKAKGLIAL